MNRYIFCPILLFLGLACANKSETIIRVDRAFLQENVIGKEVQLVDVRTQEEFEAGHIDDAVNFNIIDSRTFLRQITDLDKEKPVYLYCKMGGA